jgi:predicted SprT family Zn-dependent metalloprotease
MSRTRGHFFYNRLTGLQEITISNILFQVNDPHQWKQTLLHEMVHLAQYQKEYKVGHGNSFKRMAYEISKIDPTYVITRTSKHKAVAEMAKQKSIQSIKKQYLVRRTRYGLEKYNFIKNISEDDKRFLVLHGYDLQEIEPCTIVRNCRNLHALVKTNYYYPKSILEDITII